MVRSRRYGHRRSNFEQPYRCYPASSSNKPPEMVSIIETDCEVDFAPPLDYKEPEKPQPTAVPASKALTEDKDANVEDEPKFKPFTGSGKRLDGKVSKQQAPEVSSAAVPACSAPSDLNKRPNQQTVAPSGASTSKRQKTGKLVFGSSAGNEKEAQVQKEPVKVSEPPKKEEPKFNAFTGKSYSLKN